MNWVAERGAESPRHATIPRGRSGGARTGNECLLRWSVGLGLALMAWGGSVAGLAQQKTDSPPESRWETLEGCRLVTNSIVDGDSFHVTHGGREYIFRLCFVDAPELDVTKVGADIRKRMVDQAAYFGISPADIPQAGMLASKFTRGALEGADIKIVTRWDNAQGRSSLPRQYGIVFVHGKNLAEELVVNGLARIYGPRANWPDGPRSATFINQLKNLELQAREQKRGVWNSAAFPRVTGMESGSRPATNAAPAILDLNTATFEELQKLPGIGPILAERIIAHRPYQKLEDLDEVPNIGPKTIERLRPLVQVANPPSP